MVLSTLPALPSQAAPTPDGSTRVRGDQWHLRYLRAAEAQRVSQGEGVVVAVPDTGVDPHPDLVNNLLAGVDMIPGGGGDGRRDGNSHGTCMAGLIAAHGRGDIGVLGIAPKAKILPIYDTPPNGLGQPDDLAKSIEYAVRNGADVLSISATGSPTVAMQQAIKTALNSDVVVVAGAGNAPREDRVSYPASVDGVIAVGGVDSRGRHAEVSVTGPEIDVVAPAVGIYCTSMNGRYRESTGTSDATAIVAGAVALIRAEYPDLPASEVVHRLTATAVDKGPPGRDDEYGYGVIDLVAALTADVPPLPPDWATATPPPNNTPTTTVAAEPAGDHSDDNSTARGLATLGVIVAAAGGYLLWRRRRNADDPPPRISR
ncbi:S8 family serine peptidase [Micromonospora sp. U56]|uniref:S8 family serine peptidase n=1 Tax=Micromonospora sp. U56 TaxID=2824900 RepID=UPI001B370295|nr:S8 family serine peptidase [Micromonospora sp. U56]MBQ0893609.1 S8 family serine peptidase [Micromonospora sp. U56]